MSGKGQDEREWMKAEAFNSFARDSKIHGHDTEGVFGGGFDAGYRAALVESEARERKLEEKLAKVTHERDHEHKMVMHDNAFYKRLLAERDERRAVLVEALKRELLSRFDPKTHPARTESLAAKIDAAIDAALAGVVEAEPEPNRWANILNDESFPEAEPDGSERDFTIADEHEGGQW